MPCELHCSQLQLSHLHLQAAEVPFCQQPLIACSPPMTGMASRRTAATLPCLRGERRPVRRHRSVSPVSVYPPSIPPNLLQLVTAAEAGSNSCGRKWRPALGVGSHACPMSASGALARAGIPPHQWFLAVGRRHDPDAAFTAAAAAVAPVTFAHPLVDQAFRHTA